MEPRRAQRIAQFREAVSERLSGMSVAWIQIESGIGDGGATAQLLRDLHTLKGEGAVLGFVAATELIHAIEASVQAGPTVDGDAVLRAFDMLGELFRDDPSSTRPALAPLLDELGLDDGPMGAAPEASPAPLATAEEPTSAPHRRDTGLRIAATQLDRMRDSIGDLFSLRIRLTRLADQFGAAQRGASLNLKRSEAQLRDDSLVLATLLDFLEDTVRELRLVPVRTVLERFPRIVRDLGRDLGKQVRVVLDGENAGVDRDVVEALEAALLHLVRNSVDHGIEPADQRQAAGKPPHGMIRISARVAGRLLDVRVTDDGGGIDVEAVRRAAVKRGLVEPGTDATDERALQWIMLPGFTTRTTATQVSGRGVGLDAVHAGVQALGGSLAVVSERGRGTTFALSIPISTAFTSVLLFRVGTGRYALPTGSIEDIVDALDYRIEDSLTGPVISFRGTNVSVVAMGKLIGRTSAFVERPRLIIARTGLGLVACAGTHEHEHRDAVLRPAGGLLTPQGTATAAIALEGGEVALVLNPARLRTQETRTATEITRTTTVLVVDDSPIIRDVIAEVLRGHGVHVVEASDGVEALDHLERRPEIDMLVTDVDMPRMNGLELIRNLRAQNHRRIPAIVVSTRGSDEDKRAAIAVGADAYLVKTDLSHDSLWTLIGRYTSTS